MKKWDTVAIVGVGLIGGSIGLALLQRGLARCVVGIGRRETSLRKARERGTVSHTTTQIGQGVADAELVVVCTPVGNIIDHVCQAAAHCPPGALLTDVGSTKRQIVLELERRLGPSPAFVGSHPLAGSEKTGPDHACADLFENRVTVITPTQGSQECHVERLERFWSALGSRVVRMAPQDHDRAVAMTSHAAHVLAAALAAATLPEELPLVASGWKDTTRIAAADPQLWLEILLSNRDQVLQALGRLETSLATFRVALERGDHAQIVELLEAGKKTRDSVGS